jgi:hypothetical protein
VSRIASATAAVADATPASLRDGGDRAFGDRIGASPAQPL